MAEIQIRMLGILDIQYENMPVTLNGQRSQELFCYLLLHSQRAFAREVLADLLWSSCDSLKVSKTLRQAIWQLQTALSSLEKRIGTSVLLTSSNSIQLNPQVRLWFDVDIFERTYLLCQGIPGSKIDATTAQSIHNATALYQGDLLEGWYEDWCLRERERLQTMYLAMLDKLMDYHEMHYQFEQGVDCGMRILQYDHARECTHYRLIRMLYKCGNRTGALRQFDRCFASLDEELGVGPAQSTLTLYNQIRNDLAIDDTASNTFHEAELLDSENQLAKLVERLEKFEASLVSLRSQVEKEIRAVRQALTMQVTN